MSHVAFDDQTGRRGQGAGRARSFLCKLGALAIAAATGGCNLSGSSSSLGGSTSLPGPATTVKSQPLTAPVNVQSAQIGSGPVRVGLIVPLTQNGAPSAIGQALRNAAALALSEAGSKNITLLVEDDLSTPDGAGAAAAAVLANGAQLVIGPLYSPNVRQVGKLARAAGKPVIAFSTDTSVASQGVYLLSFLAQNEIDRVIDYAAASGKKSLAALIPDNDYGRVAEAEMDQETARRGLRVEIIEHYSSPAQAGAAAKAISVAAKEIDALFIPAQAEAMPAIAQVLTADKLDSQHVQILGTGLWNDPRVLALPALQGAWFAAPDSGGFTAFASRYRGKFGTDPPRIATLAYDAVSLAVALARTQKSQPFSESVLTNPAGFNGADGIFRFRPDGQNERGLAVLAVSNGTTKVISPAPQSFPTSTAAAGG